MTYAMKDAMKWGVLTLSSVLMVSCGGGSDDNTLQPTSQAPAPQAIQAPEVVSQTSQSSQVLQVTQAKFEVRLTNLTNAQPMSPVAVIMHKSGFNNFMDGEVASQDLELLAEGGDNSTLLSQAQAATEHVASGSTTGPVVPRAISDAVVLDVPTDDLSNLRLSVVTMLIHTNDAFTGSNAEDISNMTVGQSITINAPVWDSGTEANSELGTTMPGPDFNGEGFNAARDDMIDKVRIHQGVVSNASIEAGLPTSDLVERHRFLNPGARIVVTRTQ